MTLVVKNIRGLTHEGGRITKLKDDVGTRMNELCMNLDGK